MSSKDWLKSKTPIFYRLVFNEVDIYGTGFDSVALLFQTPDDAMKALTDIWDENQHLLGELSIEECLLNEMVEIKQMHLIDGKDLSSAREAQ